MRTRAPVIDDRSRTLLRWGHHLATDRSLIGLRRFHERHRLILLAHDPDAYRSLSALVQDAPVLGLEAAQARYGGALAEALASPTSRARHVNVLEHAARDVLDRVSDEERRSWSAVLRAYRRDDVELSVPQALLRTMLHRVAPHSRAARQAYLDPHPASATAD